MRPAVAGRVNCCITSSGRHTASVALAFSEVAMTNIVTIRNFREPLESGMLDVHNVFMNEGACILSVRVRDKTLIISAVVNLSARQAPRRILVRADGDEGGVLDCDVFLGTVSEGVHTWHIFERVF